MTRKDYVRIAEKLNAVWLQGPGSGQWGHGFMDALDAVMEALKEDNPNFKMETFEAAVYSG